MHADIIQEHNLKHCTTAVARVTCKRF